MIGDNKSAVHIFNLSAIAERFKEVSPPRAQRLNKFMNRGEFKNLNEEETKELIKIIVSGAMDVFNYIRENSPYKFYLPELELRDPNVHFSFDVSKKEDQTVYTIICYDEVTTFTEEQFKSILKRSKDEINKIS